MNESIDESKTVWRFLSQLYIFLGEAHDTVRRQQEKVHDDPKFQVEQNEQCLTSEHYAAYPPFPS